VFAGSHHLNALTIGLRELESSGHKCLVSGKELWAAGTVSLLLLTPTPKLGALALLIVDTMSESWTVRAKIIVADDEPMIATTLVEILETAGFDAVAVPDGVAAIEQARIIHPDILLSDVQMPRMNGIEAAKKIREFLPNCRIVLFSGHIETGDLLERARSEGHEFEILTKPIHPKDLLLALQHKP
jgi:CheY-like chemotaxis protein